MPDTTTTQPHTIAELLGSPLEIGHFLQLAVNATRLLAELHGQGEIHKQLCPHCFAHNAEDNSLTLIQHDAIPVSTTHNQLTQLAYVSPEQTGRTSRAVDSRSNLYSLGVIFYQLATGELPFTANDALEWVHCHIARTPHHPVALRPELPVIVSDIIMKLLAKSAEKRYQTADGLLHDLQASCSEFMATGTVAPFPLGVNDISRQLLIPQKLFGREKELDLLQQSLARVVEKGKAELLVISGYSGIGKTTLVRELHLSVIKAHGLFISGKFDQYTNVPYATIGEAFREIIRQILTKSEKQLAKWRSQLTTALGINARLMVDIIPQLELVIGKQPPVPELSPSDTEARFTALFQKFVSVFAQKSHPLVLFLDDLQWVDPATLKLIRHLVADPETSHLLLIGAYRDNEVSLSHPLMLTLQALDKECGNLCSISLGPLNRHSLLQFLQETLSPHQPGLEQLTSLIQEKTGGNPFFVTRFLSELYEEQLLSFDPIAVLWRWNMEGITAKGYSDNVVDLMMASLRRRLPATQQILQRAACIGNNFSRATVRAISNDPGSEAAFDDAVRERLLLPLGDEHYAFLHDRVQQAAYQLIAEDQRARLHLTIARLLLRQALDGSIEEQLFAIVNQYNNATTLLVEKEEKLTVAGLNLMAAKRAKNSTAYRSALEYLTVATELVDEEDWEPHYPLLFELYQEKGVLEYLNSRYDDSDRTIRFLATRAYNDREKAKLFNILIVQYTLLARYSDALTIGREALKLLGVTVPETGLPQRVKQELDHYHRLMEGRTIADLADAPAMSDKTAIVCLELLSNLVVPARYSDNELFAVIVLLNVNWSLQHGPTAKTTVGYSCFGMFLSDKQNEFRDAYQFGQVALALSERFRAMTQKCQASFVLGHYLIHWVRHLREVDATIVDGMQAGLASGELQWTGYTMAYRLFPPFYRGEPIHQVLRELPHLLHFTRKTHNQWANDTLTGFRLALAELSEPERQSGAVDEADYLAACEERKSFGALGRYCVLKLQRQYLLGDYEAAAETARQAERLSGFFSSSISVPALCFYSFLLSAQRILSSADAEQEQLREQMQRQMAQMQRWSESCPENFRHQLLLMQGEYARLAGDPLAALRFFEQSSSDAAENGFTQNQALAHERAALLCLQEQLLTNAATQLKLARSLYRLWGADKKIRLLEQNYPQLLSASPEADGSIESQIGHLDAFTVIKASQAISGEIELHRLLDILIRIVLENSGAQKASLLVYQGGSPAMTINATVKSNGVTITPSLSDEPAGSMPRTLFNYVSRSKEMLIVDDATIDEMLSLDPYILTNQPFSVLCLPLTRQGKLLGLLYLENNLLRGAFTKERVTVLEMLATQAAISLENAELYEEQARSELALRHSEETYRQIFNHCGTALIIIEEDTTISMCNKEYELLVGADRTAIEGKLKWTETIPFAAELEQMKEYHRLRRIHPSLAPQSYEFHFRDMNGTVKDVIATVTTIPNTRQSLAALQDITERKLHEAERTRLAAAIEQSAEAIFITDANWHISYANQACLQVTGYDQRELVGRHVNIVKPDNHDKEFFRNIKKVLDQGMAWAGRMALKKKNGQIYEAEATNAPVKDQQGTVTSYICTHRDVTKELKLEQDLRQAQKMEAIGTLAGGIAHDFNNLLTAILGSVELAALKIGTESRAQRDLGRITEAGNRAKELVAQILTYCRQREQEKKPLHIAAVVDEVLKLLRASLPTTIDIRQHILVDPEQDIVMADATQMHQVLMNLSTNAAYAMRDSGGTLSITLSTIECDAAMRLLQPDIPHGSCVRITVSDTGHGMDAKIRARIFDPYFTTKRFGEGTGMGLAVVEGIVKSHGGSISVYSEPGKGTTFHIMLPQLSESGSPVDSIEQPEVAHGGNERILFVDDEAILVEMGKDLFESLGYQVTATTSSREALQLFREAPDRFDLVITDMTMPVITGRELAEHIMALRPGMPVILCTGFSDAINEDMATELGIRAFVMKPYSINTLDTIVRSIFHEQQEGLE